MTRLARPRILPRRHDKCGTATAG